MIFDERDRLEAADRWLGQPHATGAGYGDPDADAMRHAANEGVPLADFEDADGRLPDEVGQ